MITIIHYNIEIFTYSNASVKSVISGKFAGFKSSSSFSVARYHDNYTIF